MIRNISPLSYKVGDYVLLKNGDVTPGVNKKLIPKCKGPYVVKKCLPNDRYVVTDVENFQVTQMPYVPKILSYRFINLFCFL